MTKNEFLKLDTFLTFIKYKIKSLTYIIIVLMNAFFLVSCGYFYGTGNPFGDKIYFEKQTSEIPKTTNIAGGNYYKSLPDKDMLTDEKNYGFNLFLGRSYSFQKYQISAGLYGFKGSYKVVIPEFEGWKPYYGTGFTVETALNDFNYGNLSNYGSVKLSVIYEDGDFYRFRKEAES